MRKLVFFALIILLAGGAEAFAVLAKTVLRGPGVPFAPADVTVLFADRPAYPAALPPVIDELASVHLAQAAPADAIVLYPLDDLQAIIDQYPAGTTFYLSPGVYRLQTLTPREGDTILGAGAATILSGAALLTSFTREGAYWVASGQTQQGETRGECADGYPRCIHPEDLYFDNVPQRHVSTLAEVAPGAWYFDYAADKVYFADDPTGRTVEISVLPRAVDGLANNVTLRSFVIEKYAVPAQRGAVAANPTVGWVIDDMTLRLNHGSGIHLGSEMRLVNSRLLANGMMGIDASRIRDTLVEANEIAFNNTAGFRSDWSGSGTKFARTERLTVRGNYVHDNAGPGLWTDIDNRDTLYENNLVVNNAGVGIFHEISYAAIIRRNIVADNGTSSSRFLLYGSQILVSSSSDVQVYDNWVIAGGSGRGIGVMQQDRGDGEFGDWLAYGSTVSGNRILYRDANGLSGVMNDSDDADFWTAAGNRFEGNTYYAAETDTARWQWQGQAWSWAQLPALGVEAGGTFTADLPAALLTLPTWAEAQQYHPGQ